MENLITIRKATVDDAETVAKIRYKTWQVAYKDLLPESVLKDFDLKKETEKRVNYVNNNQGPLGLYVAEYDGKIVGFSIINTPEETKTTREYIKDCGEVYAIYVLPKYHSIGAGYALMNNNKKIFLENGFNKFVLWCLKGNEKAKKFYERQGGVPIGEEEKALRGTMQTETCYLFNLKD